MGTSVVVFGFVYSFVYEVVWLAPLLVGFDIYQTSLSGKIYVKCFSSLRRNSSLMAEKYSLCVVLSLDNKLLEFSILGLKFKCKDIR